MDGAGLIACLESFSFRAFARKGQVNSMSSKEYARIGKQEAI